MVSSVAQPCRRRQEGKRESCHAAAHFGNKCHTLLAFRGNYSTISCISYRYSGKTQKQIVDFVRENYVKRQAFQRWVQFIGSCWNDELTLHELAFPFVFCQSMSICICFFNSNLISLLYFMFLMGFFPLELIFCSFSIFLSSHLSMCFSFWCI